MEWFSLIVLGAIVTKLVGMMMDTLFDRRRRRQDEPLAAVQARRRHARRFFIDAVSCALYAWFALALFESAIEESGAVEGAIAALIAVGAVLFARSARRRWVRWRDASLN